MLFEIDARLRVDESGIIIAEGDLESWKTRLDEWLRTPSGSVYGLPRWGNPMEEFKHEPFGSSANQIFEIALEGRLLNKLSEDLPGLGVHAIRCEAISTDLLQINFFAQGEVMTFALQNSEGEA